jgi:pimeloyl-ACP methyl ester carboxylesterase
MADIVARGVRFHVQRIDAGVADGRGSADPLVVFLHGLVMDNLSSWYFTVANQASRVADVLLYDLRGHGKSERTATGYTLRDMTADLAAILDVAAPRRRVLLVGNSFGGLLALAFARDHAERTAGLALVDAHLGDQGFGEEMAATLALEGEARDRRIAESFKDWLGRHSERKRTRLADTARDLVEKTSLLADMRATPPLDPRDFATIQVPALAIYGERSDLRARGETCLREMPRCRVVTLPGCTHSVLWEATDRVRDLLVDFVRTARGGD